MKKRHFIAVLALSLLTAGPSFGKVKIKIKDKTPQTEYAASRLSDMSGDFTVSISIVGSGPSEGFSLLHTCCSNVIASSGSMGKSGATTVALGRTSRIRVTVPDCPDEPKPWT